MAIKNCPFCGSNPKVEDIGATEWPQYQIYCPNNKCGIQPETYKYKTKKFALKAWNARIKK